MKQIGIYDTSILTRNMGDYIIMDAVKTELNEIFTENFYVNVPSRKETSLQDLRWLRHTEYFFVGGTNLLNSRMNKFRPWRVSLKETYILKNIILFGVGWHQYESKANLYTRNILKNLLNDSKLVHSVRDEYTKKKLVESGILNVINTGCPTTWKLTPDHCKEISKKSSRKVITTITDYRKDREKDKHMLEVLVANYEEVFLWVQGIGDYNYFKELDIEHSKINLIAPTLEAYDQLVRQDDIEFVGTRLHAGIRAMQHKKRSLIIGVDNRAKEINKDININYLDRADILELENIITGEFATDIKLPLEEIERWRSQF